MGASENEITSELVRIANELDALGDFEAADQIDSVLIAPLATYASVIDRARIPELQSLIAEMQRGLQLLQGSGAISAALPAAIQELQSIVQFSISENPGSQRPHRSTTRPGRRTGVGLHLN